MYILFILTHYFYSRTIFSVVVIIKLELSVFQISSIPCWQFIGWISHMVALLDKEEAVAVQRTVEEIADNYPQAIVYPFIISSESYSFRDTSTGHKNKEFVAR